MRNVRLQVAYDGSRFFGWQRQDGFPTVQEALEEAVLAATGERVTVHGASRTDTGVHALGQVASFHVDTRLDDERLHHALNANLPPAARVRRLETCRDDFHPRFEARSKRYLYVTFTTRFRPPFAHEYAHWTPYALDREAMRRAARAMVGEHDFRAFSSSGSRRRSSVRRLLDVRLVLRRERVAFVFHGRGFLYNMARILAGTLLDVGRGRLEESCVPRALAEGDRRWVGPTAPAAGLYLLAVRYAEPVFPGPARSARGGPGVFRA